MSTPRGASIRGRPTIARGIHVKIAGSYYNFSRVPAACEHALLWGILVEPSHATLRTGSTRYFKRNEAESVLFSVMVKALRKFGLTRNPMRETAAILELWLFRWLKKSSSRVHVITAVDRTRITISWATSAALLRHHLRNRELGNSWAKLGISCDLRGRGRPCISSWLWISWQDRG